jgi:conjugal transfer/entry exclusion protein
MQVPCLGATCSGAPRRADREADIISAITDAAKELGDDSAYKAVQTFQQLQDMQSVYAQVVASFRKDKPILAKVHDQLTEQREKAIDLFL